MMLFELVESKLLSSPNPNSNIFNQSVKVL